jgi:hypothetical protein
VTGAVDSDPDALRRIGFALRKLDHEADIAASRAMSIAEQTLREVQDEHRRRVRDLNRATDALRAAEVALERCLSSRERSCAAEFDHVSRAKRQVQRCEERVAISRRADSTATRVRDDLQSAARRLTSRMGVALEEAQGFLRDRGLALEEYLAGSSAAGGAPSLVPGGRAVSATGASVSGSHSGGDRPSSLIELQSTGLFEVPLELIDDFDSPVSGVGSFEKVSLADARHGIEILQHEVMPSVRSGWNPHGEDSGRLSKEARAVAGYYFGDTRVKLRRSADGNLTVVNGYHRIYVARELGVGSLPAEVQ